MRETYQTRGYKILRDGAYEHGDEKFIDLGIKMLRDAVALFEAGGAPKTANRVRFALSSALGARRNVGYRRAAHEAGRKKGHRRASI